MAATINAEMFRSQYETAFAGDARMQQAAAFVIDRHRVEHHRQQTAVAPHEFVFDVALRLQQAHGALAKTGVTRCVEQVLGQSNAKTHAQPLLSMCWIRLAKPCCNMPVSVPVAIMV